MLFDHNNIETFLSENKTFLLEGFNIFIIGKDDLPHIALAVMTIINGDTIFKDGVGVEIKGEFIEAGTAGYDEFIEKLRKA